MTSTIKVKGSNKVFTCREQDTLLRAAIREGIKIPYECNSGGCGSCTFDLIEGEVESLWDSPPGLSPRDIRKGKLLACQCKPKGNCEIDFRLDDWKSPQYPPQRFSATYISRCDLTEDMAEFCFQSESMAQFMSGQFAMLTLPGVTGDRAYSMSNVSNSDGYWQFIVKKMPGGAGSTYLFDEIKVGDVIEIDGPFGLAYLDPAIHRDVVCIGGGSGLSPIMSIARAVAANDDFSDQKLKMFYGGRGPKDICTPELLSAIDPNGTKITCYNATSDPDLSAKHGWDGDVCFVHELVKNILGDSLPEYEFYFCGPPPMTEAVQRMLMIEYKVPFEQIHFDRFF